MLQCGKAIKKVGSKQCTGIGFKKQRKKLTKISSFKFLKEDISDLQFFGQMFLFLCFFFVSPTWKI